jgi:hypothetical protein
MTKRENHYEAAFETYLRTFQIPYVAVDETRRALQNGESLKNLDFLISRPQAPGWLIDIKGRRFPTGRRKQYWKNWSTADELRSLAHWENLFGNGFGGLLVFAYWLADDQSPVPLEEVFPFRGRLYAFVGIRLDHYAAWAKPLSAKWNTVSVSVPRFRALARPISSFLTPANAVRSAG